MTLVDAGQEPKPDPEVGSGTAIEVERVRVSFATQGRSTTVLDDVSLSVASGEFVSLIGPSGCGKTTLLRVIASLVKPGSGSVRLGGLAPAEALANGSVAYAFQSSGLLEWRTALKNIMLPLELAGVDRKAATARAHELLERAGLADYAGHFPRQLSGGMQQRVAIARSLARDPRIILMDEPFASLDEITRLAMNDWLLDICAASEATVLFVTHNIREAVALSDRIVVMAPHPGRILDELRVRLPRPRTSEMWDSDEFFGLRRRGEELLHQAISGGEDG